MQIKSVYFSRIIVIIVVLRLLASYWTSCTFLRLLLFGYVCFIDKKRKNQQQSSQAHNPAMLSKAGNSGVLAKKIVANLYARWRSVLFSRGEQPTAVSIGVHVQFRSLCSIFFVLLTKFKLNLIRKHCRVIFVTLHLCIILLLDIGSVLLSHQVISMDHWLVFPVFNEFLKISY
jgi:hypothetical protein